MTWWMLLLAWLGAGAAVTAFFVGLVWLQRRITAWRCKRGMHDWEWGIGPCMDCGEEHP